MRTLFICLFIVVSGCGGSPTASVADGGQAQTTAFNCRGSSCDSAKQYCILTKVGDTTMAGTCATFASGCGGCCASNNAQSEWRRLENGSNNCDGATLLCQQSNSEVTVICQK